MELYLLRPEEHYRLYGCQNITIEDIPLEKRQHIVDGVVTILLTTICYSLYIPCIISISRQMKNSACYKILFFISIVDCMILWVIGYAHGYFAITGAVFCSHPTLIYFLGCYIWGVWMCETSGEILLVVNRCLSLLSSKLESIIFGEWRIYVWFSLAICWGIFSLFHIMPLLFTGIYYTWFFNPYVGYRDDLADNYQSKIHLFWDGNVALGLPILYVIFSLLYLTKVYQFKTSIKITQKEKMMLLQAFIISMLNCCSCSISLSMMYYVPSLLITRIEFYAWLQIHGFPPVIYLIFNSTIRNDTKQMLRNLLKINAEKRTNALTVTTFTGRT